jgi:hypothetical protein
MSNRDEGDEFGAADIGNRQELNERAEMAEARRARARAEARAIEEIEAVERVEAAEADGNRRGGGERRRRINAEQVEGASVGARAEIMRVRRDHDLRTNPASEIERR